ncbi:GIY-YIG nuclease family protein [Brachyspira catarrhinii]|uniref:GIY-YIG nuclease family protein n=1 Tax=Brachyspira catarrhinii TaxID=2528966 RepID=A0ABY2TV48_9SPIR|nr:GIY-YIG nuclease family protein [Brachyspira catarrhinii]TKZ36278.1 GIY-YIG nuclease family protein [Brachyspira catarrhinii]
MNNYYIYIILCENDSFYTGITNDLIKRFDNHKKGKGARYTKLYKPLKYLSVWEVKDKKLALRIEYYIKTKSKKIKTLFIENNKSMPKYFNEEKNENIKIKSMNKNKLNKINEILKNKE